MFKRGGTNMEKIIPAFKKPKRGYCPHCNSEESLKSVIFHDKKGDYYSCFRCQNCGTKYKIDWTSTPPTPIYLNSYLLRLLSYDPTFDFI